MTAPSIELDDSDNQYLEELYKPLENLLSIGMSQHAFILKRTHVVKSFIKNHPVIINDTKMSPAMFLETPKKYRSYIATNF